MTFWNRWHDKFATKVGSGNNAFSFVTPSADFAPFHGIASRTVLRIFMRR
jgi:hypothetical protein